MVVESDADLAGLFNPEEFGQPATFTPLAGPPSIDLVVHEDRSKRESDLGERGIVIRRTVVWAPAVDFGGVTPRKGTLTIGADSFTVTKAGLDERRRIYILGLRKT